MRFLDEEGPIVDVRSPLEFQQGHIPGSYNIPLFSDEERALVGTSYKKEGHDAAVRLGLSLVGPKVQKLSDSLIALAGDAKKLRILCFRGGMRSSSMIQLATLLGISSIQLKGGYKAFRRYCHSLFEIPRKFHVIGGYTGSGKSEILQDLKAIGQFLVDLEELARHKGSVFGAIPGRECATTEQFENDLALVLRAIPEDALVYVEDESRLIGDAVIPPAIYKAISLSQVSFIVSEKEERVRRIISEYASLPKEFLLAALSKIGKRLGNEKERFIIACRESGSLEIAVSTLLEYYDARYDFASEKMKRPTQYFTKENFVQHVKNNT